MARRVMSSTIRAALRDAARRSGTPADRDRAEKVARADHELIARMANAMKDKRAELIAEPLSRIWYQLAIAALNAFDDPKWDVEQSTRKE